MDNIAIIVDGTKFTGWESVSVHRSMRQLSGSFEFTAQETWDILPQMSCVVLVNDKKVLTGYVDSIAPSITENSHSIKIAGRCKTADLVDCSVDIGKNQFKKQTAFQICTAICKPFGIYVKNEAENDTIIDSFSFQPADSAFEVIDKLCRTQKILPLSNENGDLVLSNNENNYQGIIISKDSNVKSASSLIDFGDRFRNYKIIAQENGKGKSWKDAKNIDVRATADDLNVNRYRPLTILSEAQAKETTAQARIDWEANNRAALSETATMTLYSWLKSENEIWNVNEIIDVHYLSLRLLGKMLVEGIMFKQNSGSGSTTTLKLTRPDAFLSSVSDNVSQNPNGFRWVGGDEFTTSIT